MTTAVIIGYVSLFAVAIQTGIIMIEFIRKALAQRTPDQTYMDAVIEGSAARLRPKLMTVATTVLGLLPIMLATGSGMDITRPIATPTFGGMISSTIYVLFLIPCLFAIGEDIRRRKIVTSTVTRAAMSVAVIIVALAAAACTRERAPESAETTQRPAAAPAASASGVSIQFTSEPDPPVSGDNQVEVVVMENGAPVTDATVEAVFAMPAMPSMNMPAMRSAAPLTHAGEGRYRGTGQLSMGGTWNVAVTASRNGQEIGRQTLSVVAK
jgi:nitrogen fixation protein FixH